MAATNGTAIFYGVASKKSYVVDMYLSDTAGGLVNWDNGGGASATSLTHWRTPREPVILADWAVVTGAAQTKLQLLRNNMPTGDFLRHTLHLNTLANRPKLVIGFPANMEVRAIQVA